MKWERNCLYIFYSFQSQMLFSILQHVSVFLKTVQMNCHADLSDTQDQGIFFGLEK